MLNNCPYCGRELEKSKPIMGMSYSYPCECMTNVWERERLEKIETGLKKIKFWLKQNAKLSKDHLKADFNKCLPDQENIYHLTRSFAEKFPSVKKGIILSGNCGCGKTYLSAAIINTIISGLKPESPFIGVDTALKVSDGFMQKDDIMRLAKIVKASGLMDELKSSFDDGSTYEIMQQAKKIPLLVLDDVGAETITEWQRAQFFKIIDYRYENRKPIIITTNLKWQSDNKRYPSLPEVLGVRICDRLRDMCVYEECKAQSFRGR